MKQTAQTKKEQLIAEAFAARRELLDVASVLSEAEEDTVVLGHWTVKDVLAHLVGWDHANLEGIEAILAGRLPAFYAHYDPDWRTFNAGLVSKYKRNRLTESIAAAEESHAALLAAAEAVPAAEFGQDRSVRSPKGRRVTIAMLFIAEASDERKHAQQIKDFVAQTNS